MENGKKFSKVKTRNILIGILTIVLIMSIVVVSYVVYEFTKKDNIISDSSGANKPELVTGMIPVIYDEKNKTWVKADSSNTNSSWYNYDNKIWANAVTVTDKNRDTYLNAPVGTPISMDDINTMWVWIPRFSATTNDIDCSKIENPTVEKYPGCYINLSQNDKIKLKDYLQGIYYDFVDDGLNDLLNGKIINVTYENTYEYDIFDVVEHYNDYNELDPIKIKYDTFNPQLVIKYNGTNDKNNPGAFNITFVDNKTSAHDAFTFGTQELNGIWVGKFENSSDTTCVVSDISDAYSNDISLSEVGCNLTTIQPKIVPNAESWRGAQVSTFYLDILAMTKTNNIYGLDKITDTTLDTHMMKNNEWDAVAYLTQSIYGRCTSSTSCTKIGINNNTSYITGYGSPAGTEYDTNNGTYETILGKDASTTGNIYGVYDMSGGEWEYVMGVYTDGTQNWSGISETLNSGFSGCVGSECSSTYDGVAYPDSKYYNSDTTERIFGLPWSTRGGDCYLGDYSFYERKSDYYFGPLSRLSFSTGSGFDLIADNNEYLASRSVLVK